MGKITTDQSHAIMSVLSTNVVWANIDFEACGFQDSVLCNPKEAGAEFAAFLRNGCRLVMEDFFREMGGLSIAIPALKRPSFAELRRKFSWIKSIERDTSPTEAVKLTLATVLRLDETNAIEGLEYQRRLARKREIVLGYQQAVWLVEHQDEFPELVALLGKVYIDFSGLVVVSGGGPRRYPCVESNGKRWVLGWHWVARSFRQEGRVALSGK